MVAEVFQTFWAAMARGEFITGAAAEAGTYRRKGGVGCVSPVVCVRVADAI